MSSFGFLALAALPLLSQLAHAQSCAPISGIRLTAYGYPDGPGDTTSFGCSGSTMVASSSQNPPVAGGDGSYANPFTLATMAGSTNIKECETVYVPYHKKYYRYQDHCTGCDSNHVDLWMGTDTNGGAAQASCELLVGNVDGQTIIVNPPSTLDVDATNLWDGQCNSNQIFPNPDTSNLCSGSSGGSPNPPAASSSAAAPATTQTPSAPPVQPQAPVPTTTQAPSVPPVQPQAPLPTTTSTAAANPGPQQPYQPGQNPPGQNPPGHFGQKGVVANKAPTTLQTIASTPVSTNEPTGTPLATTNGVCTTAGAAICSVDGKQIGICNINLTVVFMDVAPGTKCVNGGMVFANS